MVNGKHRIRINITQIVYTIIYHIMLNFVENFETNSKILHIGIIVVIVPEMRSLNPIKNSRFFTIDTYLKFELHFQDQVQ